jgi:hypothetical protein
MSLDARALMLLRELGGGRGHMLSMGLGHARAGGHAQPAAQQPQAATPCSTSQPGRHHAPARGYAHNCSRPTAEFEKHCQAAIATATACPRRSRCNGHCAAAAAAAYHSYDSVTDPSCWPLQVPLARQAGAGGGQAWAAGNVSAARWRGTGCRQHPGPRQPAGWADQHIMRLLLR